MIGTSQLKKIMGSRVLIGKVDQRDVEKMSPTLHYKE